MNNHIIITVCSDELCRTLSSMSYVCIKAEPNALSIVHNAAIYAPCAVAADMSRISAEEISRAADMLCVDNIHPKWITIGDRNNELMHSKNVICMPEAPDREQLAVILNGALDKSHHGSSNERELEGMVTEIIRKIGIPANIKGYRYLRNAILLAAKDSTILDSITKRLYPEIADLNNTTPSRVERAIRHAISSAWERGDGDCAYIEKTLRCRLNFMGDKPTNSELIALISDSLKLRYV